MSREATKTSRETNYANSFVIGQSRRGLWVVREARGRCAAIFRCYRDAMHYARREGGADAAIIFEPRGLEFGLKDAA